MTSKKKVNKISTITQADILMGTNISASEFKKLTTFFFSLITFLSIDFQIVSKKSMVQVKILVYYLLYSLVKILHHVPPKKT